MEHASHGEWNLLVNTAGSIRQSLQTLISAMDLITDHLDLSSPEIARQSAYAMRSIFQLQQTALYLDLYHKLHTGDYPFSRRLLNLTDVAFTLADHARWLLSSAGIALDISLPKQDVFGTADRDLLELMLWELISNASAHCADGKISLSMKRSASRSVIFTVTNQSDRSLPDRLFDRHLAGPEEFSGSMGLGLGIVSEGAKLHGGSLLLSCSEDRQIRAVLSIEMGKQENALGGNLYSSPISVSSVGLVCMSRRLPSSVYDPRNLL